MAVFVGIDQSQRPFVEFQAAGGAAKRGSKLGVELIQRFQIGPGFQANLIEPARTEEALLVRTGRDFFLVIGHY
jgi:hypothetical protein